MHLNLIIVTWFSELIVWAHIFYIECNHFNIKGWETLEEKLECVEATFQMLNDWWTYPPIDSAEKDSFASKHLSNAFDTVLQIKKIPNDKEIGFWIDETKVTWLHS